MANHVTSGIEIVEGNDAVTEWFAGLCERITIPADEREVMKRFVLYTNYLMSGLNQKMRWTPIVGFTKT